VLLFCFLIISYVYVTDSAHFFVIVNQIFGLTAFVIYLVKGKMKVSWLVPTVLLMSSVLVSSILISRSPFGFGNIVNVVSASGIAILVLRNRLYMNIILIWFFLVTGYYFWLILQGVHPDLAHSTNNSRNSISVHMLFVTSTIYILYYLNRMNFPWWPAFLFLVISLWAIGRGGILTSSILFFSFFYIRLKYVFKRRRIWSLILLGLPVFLFIGNNVVVFFNDIVELERTVNDALSRTELTSSRNEILVDYFEKSTLIDFIIGQDLYKGVMWHEWGANTHNSFVSLNAYAGLFGFVGFFYWIYVNIGLFRLNFILGILMFIVFIRLMTEYVVWFSVFDYLPFLFIYLYAEMKDKMKMDVKPGGI